MNLRRTALILLLLAVTAAAPALADVKANAGPRQRVDEGANVTLDGSRSRADQGESLSFSWTQISGPTVTLAGPDTANPTFTAPQVDNTTQLRFQLTVTQGDGNSDSASVRVQVRNTGSGSGNQPPFASAGGDRTVAPGSFVLLDPSGSSDPEGQPLSFTWVQVSGPAVDIRPVNALSGQYGFTAPSQTAAPIVVRLTARDDQGAEDTDDAAITVSSPANRPPVANAGLNRQVAPGAIVSLNGNGSSDPDGDALSFSWTQVSGPAVAIANAAQANASFVAPAAEGAGPVIIRLTVNDGRGGTGTDDLIIAISAVTNRPPRADAGADQQAAAGSTVILNGGGSSDPDGDALTYAWTQVGGIPVSLSNAQQQVASFVAPPGAVTIDLPFRLSVTDGRGGAASDDIVVHIIPASTSAPTADAGPDRRITSTGPVTLDGSGSSDPAGRPLTFHWDQIAGPAVTIQNPSSAVATFTPRAVLVETLFTFQLTVTSSAGSAVDVVTLTLVPAAAPPPQPQQPQFMASVDSFSIYPNPYDPHAGNVTFEYTLGADSDVTITIYDLFGRLVRELKPTGIRGGNRTSWDGRNGEGHDVANGGYVVQVRAVDGAGHSARATDRVAVVR